MDRPALGVSGPGCPFVFTRRCQSADRDKSPVPGGEYRHRVVGDRIALSGVGEGLLLDPACDRCD